ncbi:hypothetical protein ACJ7Z2_07435 [Mannheimia glucosida]|uniref:hypothetical protein n=1 Tax=Mannheimia glucosida TaxID=85401 RepID=UPI003917BA07
MNKVSFADEFYIAQRIAKIGYLAIEVQKIEIGMTKSTSQEMLNNVLTEYKKELSKLKHVEH